MTDSIVCFDTDVLIKFLIIEEPRELSDVATKLVHQAIIRSRLVAPAFAWAEFGSVLRKKVRRGHILPSEADAYWIDYKKLPIQFLDSPAIRARAWTISQQFDLPTLYDAAFLACVEVTLASTEATREFWTADRAFVRALGSGRPSFLYVLGEDRGA